MHAIRPVPSRFPRRRRARAPGEPLPSGPRAERKGSGKVEQQQVGAGQGGRVRNRVHPARHGRYFMVGMMNSAPVRMPDGQRAVTVLGLVKKRTPSGPCMFESPNSERFQPPKV